MKGIESLTRTLPENSDREIFTPEAVEMPFDAQHRELYHNQHLKGNRQNEGYSEKHQ